VTLALALLRSSLGSDRAAATADRGSGNSAARRRRRPCDALQGKRLAHSHRANSEAKKNGQPSDGLMLVYLVELDGGETDEQVDPGAFPPARS
jgi:hypothetical protein